MGISRKGNEQGRLTKVIYNGHEILKQLHYESITTHVTGWQNHPMTKTGHINISTDYSICQTIIQVHMKVCLVVA